MEEEMMLRAELGLAMLPLRNPDIMLFGWSYYLGI
jgi:hypothetical protein